MVLTNDEYQKAKSHPRLASLLKLRNATKSYIIQCLADREIQKAVNDFQQQSRAYRSNCEVIHSPVQYVNVEAADGVGWNSTTCKPQKLSFLKADNQDGQQSKKILKLKRQITKRDETIVSLKEGKIRLKENHQICVGDLKTENSRQSQTIQQLRAILSENEKEICVWKELILNTRAKTQQLETLLAAKEKTIVVLRSSKNRLQDEFKNATILINNLRKEKNELIKTSGDASSRGESTNTNYYLLVFVGFSFMLYKKPESIPLILKKLGQFLKFMGFIFF